jgi:purine catabolism regulator
MMISVEELLRAPVMRGSRLLAGHEVVGRRGFTWTSVIEWQAVRFVNPDELVLTTAIGLDEVMLTSFLQELLESPAAAICVSLHPTGPVSRVPRASLDKAEARGIPVVGVPWEIGFADINRWAADELLRRRKAATLDEPIPRFPGFTDVLLEGGTPNDVAAALEACLTRPVLIFDAGLLLAAHGPMAEREMNPDAITNLRLRAAKLSESDVDDLSRRLQDAAPAHHPGEPELGLPRGTVAAAMARRRLMGFVYVLDNPEGAEIPESSELDLAAVREAANVIAIDGMRRRVAAPADELDREDFLWEVVRGDAGPPDCIVRRATELGFDPRARLTLAVGQMVPKEIRRSNGTPILDSLIKHLRELCTRRRLQALISNREDLLLVLVPASGSEATPLRGALEEARPGHVGVRWGLAGTPRSLCDLAAAFRDARAALRIGAALGDKALIADAGELEPFVLLGEIARDPQAADLARAVVQPLLDYDRASGRDLLGTIETYLATGGNASSAARQLALNRTSMLYRLRKFEELTGRDLSDPADRFVVDLSIKLFRLRALSAASDVS